MQANTVPEAAISVPLDITVDRAVAREVLGAILHAILFHRLFGSVHPRSFDVFDVTFPGVADAEIERLVNERLDVLWRALDDSRAGIPSKKRGQLIMTFYERRPKKTWFSTAEEEIPWEIWTLNAEINVPQTEPRDVRQESLSDTLNDILLTILTHTSSDRGRQCVPPIRTAGVLSPFTYHIAVKVGGIEYEGSAD